MIRVVVEVRPAAPGRSSGYASPSPRSSSARSDRVSRTPEGAPFPALDPPAELGA